LERIRHLLQETTNLRAWLIALVVAIIGVALLGWTAHPNFWIGHESWQELVRAIGSLLIVAVAVSLLWEVVLRRSFLNEVMNRVKTAEEVEAAGLLGFTDEFYREPDWVPLFKVVKELDIFFAYGRTWRHTFDQQLKEVAKRNKARIRVVLPDPESTPTMSQLAERFSYTPEKLKSLIEEAKAYFEDLRSVSGNTGAKIEIWLLPDPPLFTFYRFDHTVILTLYSHAHERRLVPTFIIQRGGKLYEFAINEFEAILKLAHF